MGDSASVSDAEGESDDEAGIDDSPCDVDSVACEGVGGVTCVGVTCGPGFVLLP